MVKAIFSPSPTHTSTVQSPIQEPPAFLPEWTGSPQPPNHRCEKESLYRCGVIICTITDLKPAPAPFTQITLFARLYVS